MPMVTSAPGTGRLLRSKTKTFKMRSVRRGWSLILSRLLRQEEGLAAKSNGYTADAALNARAIARPGLPLRQTCHGTLVTPSILVIIHLPRPIAPFPHFNLRN